MAVFNDAVFQKKIGWTPHKGQAEVLASQARDKTICAGVRWGKALWIETPILTNEGYKKLIDIKVGDYVFTEKGKRTKVLHKSEVYKDRICYKVIFSDGSEIIADANHDWVVEDYKYRKNTYRSKNTGSKLRKITTKELSKSVFYSKGRINYSIPLSEKIEFEKKILPIEPYLFGIWLGDGDSDNFCITNIDEEIVKYLYKTANNRKETVKMRRYPSYAIVSDKTQNGRNKSLTAELSKLGVKGKKHIPDIYRYSSIEQRIELLKGLMDTDGYVEKNGNCEYVSVSKRLANDVWELILSLGIKATLCENDCKLYGRNVGKKYRIHFTPDICLFKIKRKSERQNQERKKDIKRRFIVAIEKVKSVPVQCLTVDNPVHLFLAGKQLIATHNSQTAAYEVARQLMYPNQRIWIVSLSYDMAKMVFNHLVDFLGNYDRALLKKVSFRPPQRLEIKEWNSWVECKSSGEPESLMGQELDMCVVDEAARTPGEIWDRYLAARLSSRQGKSIAISTPFGQNNWFYKRYIQTKETNSSWHFKTINNPYFKQEEWDRLKRVTPEMIWRQEYEAEFLRDAAAVFRGMDKITADTLRSPERSFYTMGVDLGKHNDYSVITVIDTQTNNVVHLDKFIGIEYPLQKARIIATAKQYNSARVCIDATHGSVGEPIAEDLTREGLFVEDFGFSGKTKKELIEKLSIFIEQGFIKIPSNEELLDELNLFGYKLTDSGNVQYSAPEGGHDDMVMSLALAVWSLNPGRPKTQDPIARELAKTKIIKNRSYI